MILNPLLLPIQQQPNPITWPGLGINYNYNGSGASPTADLTFLRELGFSKVRLLIVDYTLASTITDWRIIVQTALNLGFSEVLYGLSAYPGGSPITSTNWTTFSNALQTEAAWAAGLNNSRITFTIGNEEDEHVDGTTLTAVQLQTNLVNLSTTIKTANPNLTIIYSANQNHLFSWLNLAGIGSFDKLGGNVYDTISNFNFFLQTLYSPLPQFNKLVLTEWNCSNGYTNFNNEVNYASDMAARLKTIKNAGIKDGYFYNFMEGANQFGLKNNSTSAFRQAWQSLLSGV